MSIEVQLDRVIDALERIVSRVIVVQGETPVPATKRGRPAKGEVNGVATASAAVPAATPEVTEASASAANTSPSEDPFAVADVVPETTMDNVRKAILALRDATDQGTALAVLKKYGASNFGEVKPEVTGNIVRDAQLALPATKELVVEDPFAEASTPAAAKLSIDDVKKAIVQAQKRTATDIVQKIVMENGGAAPGANGAVGPSLKALPEANYAKVIELIGKLPITK